MNETGNAGMGAAFQKEGRDSRSFYSALVSNGKNGKVVCAIDDKCAVVEQRSLTTPGKRPVLVELAEELCNFVFVFDSAKRVVNCTLTSYCSECIGNCKPFKEWWESMQVAKYPQITPVWLSLRLHVDLHLQSSTSCRRPPWLLHLVERLPGHRIEYWSRHINRIVNARPR